MFTNVEIIPYFCNMDFAQFILAHEGEDPAALALARDRYASEVEDFDLALNTLEVRRKLRVKVPQWYAVPQLRFPFRLSGEQCSSAETARYKASVALRALTREKTVADLTGGLGVDSWAFAQVASAVLYNEMRPELAAAASANFKALGLTNVRVSCAELRLGGLREILDGFTPDVIFLDPARRAADGRKVFRLEDCEPDVLQLLPELLAAAPRVLLKLSPMADITLVCKQLGYVREVHVVAADGECKELLLLLERGYSGAFRLFVWRWMRNRKWHRPPRVTFSSSPARPFSKQEPLTFRAAMGWESCRSTRICIWHRPGWRRCSPSASGSGFWKRCRSISAP